MSKAAIVSEVLGALLETSRKKKARDVLRPKPVAEESQSGETELSEDELAMLMSGEPEEDDEEEG